MENLMRFVLFLILFLGTAPALRAQPAPAAGFRTLNVPGIEAVIWYPAATSEPVNLVAGNKVFVGVQVVENAPVLGTGHPVVVLSHGFSGLWRNQAWLAERL